MSKIPKIFKSLTTRGTTNIIFKQNLARSFSSFSATFHGAKRLPKGEGIQITFITQEGDKVTVGASNGDSVLDVAHANNIDLEGACEASLACSTCHVILEQDTFEKLEEPTDEENDMLDLAFGLTETSRLGCQIVVTPELEGSTFKIPSATRNMAVDGYKPKPH
ncbi:mitochondrial matrix iron-sulfur protein, variant 3 [Entomophthora muscae]|uniref:Mitochondrial matrix iron-sulfur protein, variant 3 n=2 Tax=Entomophthora muscae TaxID=34485 RepID=A0ACC2RJB7_9FUNG|nr:mitochondrial matrix iron-sulfur protein, variant 3 [Entomophthora muscae]